MSKESRKGGAEEHLNLDNLGLSRGQLLNLAAALTEKAMEVKEAERHIAPPGKIGSPKDPAVRKAAALYFNRARNIEGMSFEDIGGALGITRERAHQLFHLFFPAEKEEEANHS